MTDGEHSIRPQLCHNLLLPHPSGLFSESYTSCSVFWEQALHVGGAGPTELQEDGK